MELEVFFVTHKGFVRARNEDALLLGDLIVSGVSLESVQRKELEKQSFTVAVADGMGGHSCGDVASYTALETLKRIEDPKNCFETLRRIEADLDKIAKERPECWNLGTVLSYLHLNNSKAYICSVGDTRIYSSLRGLLTEDHRSPFGFLTSALVGGEKVLTEHCARVIEVEPGETFFLCSDGLWEAVEEEEILNTLQEKDMLDPLNGLFFKALERSTDNVTFVALRILAKS